MSEEKLPKSSDDDDNDIISSTVGEYGRWQFLLTLLISLFNIPCTWHIFVPTFQQIEQKIWCARPIEFIDMDPNLWINLTQPLGFCSIIDVNRSSLNDLGSIQRYSDVKLIKCDKWEFEGEGQTLITEFELFCDRKYLKNLSEMMFLAGVALGGLIGGMISDKYGRKRTLISAVFLQALLGNVIAFSPWIEMYIVLRALLGFVSVSVVFSGFVLTVELVGGSWRIISGVSYMFPVSVAYIMIAGIAWVFRDWRQLQLIVSLPGFILTGLWWVLPESPLWLLAMGRTKELIPVLQQGAAFNQKDKERITSTIDKYILTKVDTCPDSAGVLDLFRTSRLRKNTFFLAIIWFTVYIVYYGLVLNLGHIGGDLYINTITFGAVEIPAIAASIYILLRMGRRWPLSLTIILSGVACLLTLPLPYIMTNHQWLVTTFAMIGKLSISSSNAVIPVFTAELYPTTVRNIGVGASNVTAGIALILIPYLWNLAQMHASIPMAVLAAFGIVGGLCVLFLPETGNEPLEVTLKDVGNEKRNSQTTRDVQNKTAIT